MTTGFHVQTARDLELAAGASPELRAQELSEAAEYWHLAGIDDRAEECFLAAIADGGEVAGSARAAYAQFLFDIGEAGRAHQQLAELAAQRPDATARYRGGEALECNDDERAALRWYTAGITAHHGDVEDLDIEPASDLWMLLSGRRRVRQALGEPEDRWDELVESRRQEFVDTLEQWAAGAAADSPRSVHYSIYWPAQEFAKVVEHWPELGELHRDHDHYRRNTEGLMRQGDRSRYTVAHLVFDDLIAFAESNGADPGDAGTRERFVRRHPPELTVEWPPGRNEPCWCGSVRKYKKCCGAPGFATPPEELRTLSLTS